MARRIIDKLEDFIEYVQGLPDEFAFDYETTSLKTEELMPTAMSFAADGYDSAAVLFNFTATYFKKEKNPAGGRKKIDVWYEYELDDAIDYDEAAPYLRELFARGKCTAHNGKYDFKVAFKTLGVEPVIADDTMIMWWLLDPNQPKGLKYISKKVLGTTRKSYEETVGQKVSNIDWTLVDFDEYLAYAAMDAEDTWALKKILRSKIDADNDLKLTYEKLELEVLPVVAHMELRGVRIDLGELEKQQERIEAEMEEVSDRIFDMAGVEFNLGSPKQLAEILFDHMGLPVIGETASGGRSTDKNALAELAYMGFDIAEELQYYSKLSKLYTGYIKSIPELVDSDGRLRGNFNQAGTKTSRFCIAGHQKVLTVGGEVPIEDIEVGTMVYCYDNEGKVRIRKVLNKWDKGIADTVKVKWQGVVNKGTGIIQCTPNHLFKTKKRGWVEAKDLKREKVYHLTRKDNIENGNNRPRLYGTNSFMEKEQDVIKLEYFKAPRRSHLHHIDGNTENNTIPNLVPMSAEEHTRLHSLQMWEEGRGRCEHLKDFTPPVFHGEDNTSYRKVSKVGLYRMLLESGGRPSMVDMDFATYKKKCADFGIDLKEAVKRFAKGVFLSRGRIKETSDMTTREAYLHLGVGYGRLRELQAMVGHSNHVILSVTEAEPCRVWDIEIEEFNNFICEELCVHNSSSGPNLQNQPNNKKYPIRKSFVPAKGYGFIVTDWSQIELRIMAHESRDPVLIDIFKNNGDIHQETQDRINKMLGAEILERRDAKIVNFGVLYGMSGPALANMLNAALKEMVRHGQITETEYKERKITEEQGKMIVRGYYKAYPGFERWAEAVVRESQGLGYVRTFTGFRRPLPEFKRKETWGSAARQAVNTKIQGGAAGLNKLGLIKVHRMLKEKGYDAHLLLDVHDEFVIECKLSQIHRCADDVDAEMCNVFPKCRVPILADTGVFDSWEGGKSGNGAIAKPKSFIEKRLIGVL